MHHLANETLQDVGTGKPTYDQIWFIHSFQVVQNKLYTYLASLEIFKVSRKGNRIQMYIQKEN